ncbi:signal peptidase II [Maritimibacter fusiformis]|uniref:Lipoprotein signal peptidase n=1 Tax=Maritimibacter fusiformis TaxID=2603819 RepID=A0A5D0RAD7_9RHOB|nr:signal peptidase II [Maritimibacter fusiformis]TYB77564.1 signal peptidase II [Maritimibacter fusiformis]
MRILAITAAVIFALDQLLKLVVVQVMDLANRGEIDVLPPFLNLRMAWNRGVNFGLLSSNADVTRWALIFVALVITFWVIWWVRRETMRPIALVSAGLLVGGALGNVIDRIIYGAVADFLNMSCCGWRNPWSFNLADVAIFAGAIGLALFSGAGKSGDKTP